MDYKIELKSVRIYESLSEETTCFTASDLRKYERLDKIKRIYDKSGKEYFVTSSHHV